MNGLVDALNDAPLAAYMLVVALGFLVGRLGWRGFALGPAGGTLLVALFAGALGLSFDALYGPEHAVTLGGFGFVLFIYSVGFEAGPSFFSGLRGGAGLRFVVIGTIVSVTAFAVAVVCGRLLGLGESVTAGLLSGALTSAPTYAAAAEVCDDTAALAVSFALTYPFGLVGVVLLVQFLPRWMGQDLAAGTVPDTDDKRAAPHSPEMTRAYEVREPGVIGRTLRELDLTHRCGCYVTQLHRGPEIHVPGGDTRLEEGDHVFAHGRFDELEEFARLVGPGIYDEDLRRHRPLPRRVRVTARAVDGRSLRDLDLAHRHGCLVTGVERGGIVIEPMPELELHRYDVLELVGPHAAIRACTSEVGRFERSTQETDIAIYAGGIFLGLLLARLPLFGLQVRLGLAGGLLLAGVVLGRLRRIGPFSAHVPRAARQLVRDLGILLFIAETGVAAGGSPLAGLREVLVPTLFAACLVTILPVVVAALAGRWLRLRAVDTWGSIGGGMTSSSALIALRRAADSNEPALAYAASYAFASVLVTIAGQAVVALVPGV